MKNYTLKTRIVSAFKFTGDVDAHFNIEIAQGYHRSYLWESYFQKYKDETLYILKNYKTYQQWEWLEIGDYILISEDGNTRRISVKEFIKDYQEVAVL